MNTMGKEAENKVIDIVWCCDGDMLPALAVSVTSALRNLGPDCEPRVWIVQEGISDRAKAELARVAKVARANVELSFVEAVFSLPPNAALLHGNRMAYARLFLTELLPGVNKIIYLDSDILVTGDLAELWAVPVDSWLGAVPGGPAKYALEGKFYVETGGLTQETIVFNSGILVMRLDLIRVNELKGKFEEFVGKFGPYLVSCDQMVLNVLSANIYTGLPTDFNLQVTPDTIVLPKAVGILHFVGRPKPWDLGAGALHPAAKLWRNGYRESGWKPIGWRARLGLDNAKSAWASRRSIGRTLLRRLKKT